MRGVLPVSACACPCPTIPSQPPLRKRPAKQAAAPQRRAVGIVPTAVRRIPPHDRVNGKIAQKQGSAFTLQHAYGAIICRIGESNQRLAFSSFQAMASSGCEKDSTNSLAERTTFRKAPSRSAAGGSWKSPKPSSARRLWQRVNQPLRRLEECVGHAARYVNGSEYGAADEYVPLHSSAGSIVECRRNRIRAYDLPGKRILG